MAADAERRADSERATRRQFFRVFGRQTVNNAGSVLAGVEALRRTSQEAMGDLLGGDEEERGRVAMPPAPGIPSATGQAAFASPYRFTGNALEILDQAALPQRAPVIDCRAASEVASAIRLGALSGGPVLGQVAAYTLALVVADSAGSSEYARVAALHAAADTLRAARPTNQALASAIERVLDRARSEEGEPGPFSAAVLDEADRVAAGAATDHAQLGSVGAAALRPRAEAARAEARTLAVLMHGDHGPLTGGHVGPGAAVMQTLAADGHAAHAWLTEAAPLLEGRRAAWAFSHLGIAHTLVPDTALGWLLTHRRLDVLLLRAERVSANGDLVAPLGSLVAAQVARAAGLPVIGVAPLSLFDPATPDGSAVRSESHMPPVSAGAGPRLDPLAEIVPNDLLDTLLTDEGELRAPYGPALAAAAAARAERHAGRGQEQA